METFKERRSRLERELQQVGKALGPVLRRKLVEREWLNYDLAMRSGLAPSTVDKLVDGSRANPTLETILRLAVAMELDPVDFIHELLDEADAFPTGVADSSMPTRHIANFRYAKPIETRVLIGAASPA